MKMGSKPGQTAKTNGYDRYESGKNFSFEFNEGLPNIGNTCFLNSALQTLYSATNFRNLILKIKPFSEFSYLLQQIFLCICQQKGRQEKVFFLRKLVQLLQNHHQQYNSYSQQDSYDFLNFIIQKLGEQQPMYLEMFTIQYTVECNCKRQKTLKYVQTLIPIEHQICSECNRPQIYKLNKSPPYLICVGNKKSAGKDILTFSDQFQGSIFYSICSKIIYFGSGKSGHYISYRKDKNSQFCFFDDSYVTRQRQSNRNGPITVFLYENIKGEGLDQKAVKFDEKRHENNLLPCQKSKVSSIIRENQDKTKNDKGFNREYKSYKKQQKKKELKNGPYEDSHAYNWNNSKVTEKSQKHLKLSTKQQDVLASKVHGDKQFTKNGQFYQNNPKFSKKEQNSFASEIQSDEDNKPQMNKIYKSKINIIRNNLVQTRQIYFKIANNDPQWNCYLVQIINGNNFIFLDKKIILVLKLDSSMMSILNSLQNQINSFLKDKLSKFKNDEERSKFYRNDFINAKSVFTLDKFTLFPFR